MQETYEVDKLINSPGELGEGVFGLIFARYMPLASQNPYPIIVRFCGQIINPILVTLGTK